tara:strand:+ start:1325 stop:1492 length:168 start_codon:yes stop_codon:yes gene_type:complete
MGKKKQDYPVGYTRTGSDGIRETYMGNGVWAEVNPELKIWKRASNNRSKLKTKPV